MLTVTLVVFGLGATVYFGWLVFADLLLRLAGVITEGFRRVVGVAGLIVAGVVWAVVRLLERLEWAARTATTEEAPPVEVGARLVEDESRSRAKREVVIDSGGLHQIEPVRRGSYWRWSWVNLGVVVLGRLYGMAGWAVGSAIAVGLVLSRLAGVTPRGLEKYRHEAWLRGRAGSGSTP